MRKLPIPIEKSEDVFKLCISKIRKPCLRKRLSDGEQEIKNAAIIFKKRVVDSELYLIPMNKTINNVSAEEMVKVYVNSMVKKGQPGRPFYDKLLSMPKHGKCPLCGHRLVSTIDHHLPKKHYPIYSVIPINLIPACKDCNTIKDASIPSKSEEETIHPYFDNIDSETWLKARLLKNGVVEFYVDTPSSWEEVLSKRINHHFKILKLARLFSLESANELANINYNLKRLHTLGGATFVKNHLVEQAESRSDFHLNSWETALYTTLANSKEFCNGGFNI